MSQFGWAIHVALLVFFVWLIKKLFHVDPTKMLAAFTSEFKDLARRRYTVGSMNALGLVAVVIIGLVTMTLLEFKEVMSLVASLIGDYKVEAFAKAATFPAMFYFVGGFTVVSLLAVLADEWRKTPHHRQRKRQRK